MGSVSPKPGPVVDTRMARNRERDLKGLRDLAAGWHDTKARERKFRDMVSGEVLRVRRLHGLTWQELANIVGVTRPDVLAQRVLYYRDNRQHPYG